MYTLYDVLMIAGSSFVTGAVFTAICTPLVVEKVLAFRRARKASK